MAKKQSTVKTVKKVVTPGTLRMSNFDNLTGNPDQVLTAKPVMINEDYGDPATPTILKRPITDTSGGVVFYDPGTPDPPITLDGTKTTIQTLSSTVDNPSIPAGTVNATTVVTPASKNKMMWVLVAIAVIAVLYIAYTNGKLRVLNDITS